jgi:hypothetical protein
MFIKFAALLYLTTSKGPESRHCNQHGDRWPTCELSLTACLNFASSRKNPEGDLVGCSKDNWSTDDLMEHCEDAEN